MSRTKAVIFDGRKSAFEKERKMMKTVRRLRKRGVTPRLVSILVGNDQASRLYMVLKKKAAERVGVKLEVKEFLKETKVDEVIKLIKRLSQDKSVHGVMVQLPLPERFSKKDKKEIIDSIKRGKDVDGMREDSSFQTPTVKAVMTAIKQAEKIIVRPPLKTGSYKVVVVGAKGVVGRKIVKVMTEMGYDVSGLDLEEKDLTKKTKNADILISSTGQKGLIKGNMIKDKAVIIDVGAPDGDIVFDEVLKKAFFITPVPGGIGPLTIAYLLENLVEAAKSNLQ